MRSQILSCIPAKSKTAMSIKNESTLLRATADYLWPDNLRATRLPNTDFVCFATTRKPDDGTTQDTGGRQSIYSVGPRTWKHWPVAVAIAAEAACWSAVCGPRWNRVGTGSCTWNCGWTSSSGPSGTRAEPAAGADRWQLQWRYGGRAAAAEASPDDVPRRRTDRPGRRRTTVTVAVCSRCRRHRRPTRRRPRPRRNRPRPRNRCCSTRWSRSSSPCPAALPWSP